MWFWGVSKILDKYLKVVDIHGKMPNVKEGRTGNYADLFVKKMIILTFIVSVKMSKIKWYDTFTSKRLVQGSFDLGRKSL